MIIKQRFTEPETEVKWYFDSTGISRKSHRMLYQKNRLRGNFACTCITLCLRLRLKPAFMCGVELLYMTTIRRTSTTRDL